MPDITMCTDHNCGLRESCYRYTAKPSDWQSYFTESPKSEDGSCKYFWSNKEYKKKA